MGIKPKTEVKIMKILADYSAQLDSGAVFSTAQARDIAQRAYAPSIRLIKPIIRAVYLYLLNNRKRLKEKIVAGDFTPIQSVYCKTLDEKLAAAIAPEFFNISRPLSNDTVRNIHQQVFNRPGTRRQLRCIRNSLTKNRSKLIALAKKWTKTEHVSGNAESNGDDGRENVDGMELDKNTKQSTNSQASDSNIVQVQHCKKSDNGLAKQSPEGMSHNNDDDETLVDETDSPEQEKLRSEYMIPDDVSQPQSTDLISNGTKSLTQPSEEMNRDYNDSNVPLVSASELPQEEAL